MEIGERIKHRRELLGLSQDELAKKVGYKSRSSINKIETDGRGLPQSKIVAFAKALETTPAYLMGWDELPANGIIKELSYLKESFQDFPKTSKDAINSKEISDAIDKIMNMNNAILNSPRTTWTFSENEVLIGIKFILSYYHINWRKYNDSTLISIINSNIFKNFIINLLDTFTQPTTNIPNSINATNTTSTSLEKNKQNDDDL